MTVLQANNDDYVDDCSVEFIIDAMNRALASRSPYHASVWYGDVSSESPLLSFACVPNAGVYVSVNLRHSSKIFLNSDDFHQTYKFNWGEDIIFIPHAYITDSAVAASVFRTFCETGDVAADTRWRDISTLEWDPWEPPEHCK